MQKLYLTAQECAELLGISLGHSYRICRELNKELEMQNYITVAGKVKYQEHIFFRDIILAII